MSLGRNQHQGRGLSRCSRDGELRVEVRRTTSTSRHRDSCRWGVALECPTVGAWQLHPPQRGKAPQRLTVGASHFIARQWGPDGSMPHRGGVALQCPTVGEWQLIASQWAHDTSMPHGRGEADQKPTEGKRQINATQWGSGTSMLHSGGAALPCPAVGAWQLTAPQWE